MNISLYAFAPENLLCALLCVCVRVCVCVFLCLLSVLTVFRRRACPLAICFLVLKSCENGPNSLYSTFVYFFVPCMSLAYVNYFVEVFLHVLSKRFSKCFECMCLGVYFVSVFFLQRARETNMARGD